MKNRRRTTTKAKRPSAPKGSGRREPSSTNADTKNALLERERDELLEQQKATAEVLRVISTSPGELEPVFQAMLENAVRICEAKFGTLYLRAGDAFRAAALHNAPPAFVEFWQRGPHRPGPSTVLSRVLRTKEVVHISDITADQAYTERDPLFIAAAELGGFRTVLAVPMLKETDVLGAIYIYRQEVRPFSNKQIALLASFASQAVIAIENTRLLNELRESLQQQTATADVLKVISSSPGELEPVFQAMLENATRICHAKFGVLQLYEGRAFRIGAVHNAPPAFAEAMARRELLMRPTPQHPFTRMVTTKEVVQIADLTDSPAYKERDYGVVMLVELARARTFLAVPMLKENEVVGVIAIYRQDVLTFADNHRHHQQEPARPDDRTARRPLFDGPGLLRPGPAAPQRPDHPPPARQHLRPHRRRTGILRLLHQGPRPGSWHRYSPPQPQAPPQLRAAIKTIEHHIDERLAQSRLPATA